MLLPLPLVLLLAAAETPPNPPIDLGVTEETGTALAQVDVILTGSPEALARIHAGSFALWVDGRKMERVLADGLCTATGKTSPPENAALPATRPATWILYFDQPHLTIPGRARAIQLARDVLAEILGPGARATIVSNHDRLTTVHPMSSDRAALLSALDRLEQDAGQVDGAAASEEFALEELHRLSLEKPLDYDRMLNLVRQGVRDERWRSKRDHARLRMVLGRLAEFNQPKGVLYFADTMRRNPGDHYLKWISAKDAREIGPSISGEFDFDRVVRQATALGIRFYTIEPQPLQGSSVHGRDAQGALHFLAAETGGRAFVNGVTSKRMISGFQEDAGCHWLLSFDPAGLKQDTALRVRVEVDVPGVRVRSQTQTMIQSASERLTSRLLASFALETEDRVSNLRVSFVPLAWKDGKYSLLLQVVAPPTSLPSATWDLGASVVAAGRVGAETSARTRVGGSGVSVALESEVELKPGPFELVAVAREVTSERVVSSRVEGTWPHPDDALAEVVQPVVLQPGPGAFTRDGEIRKSGSLVHGPQDPLDPARPTALVALVCRSKMVKSALDVSRVLEGASTVDFPPLALDLGSERCGQVRDLIPPKTLGPGRYRYQIVVKEKGTEIGRGETSFVVPEP